MMEDIGANPNAVQGITYTLNAPRGTTITRIDYYGPIPPGIQQVNFIADQDAGHYHAQTNVRAGSSGIAVTAYLMVGDSTTTVNGRTNMDIQLDLTTP
ncbi:MAG TPA: hypothetical protein VM536_14580 [Chloroflexia bacterium]|nr:hypothetical protein [Chloroflexia bacterium]